MAVLAVGCGGSRAPKPAIAPAPAELTQAAEYNFDSLDERPVSSTAMAGKPTVIAFITTWDLVCQAQTGFLVAMAKHDAQTTNYVLVAVHPRTERELVETYARTLKVTFPVALTERSALGEDSPFGDVTQVPTVVLLDRKGRVRWRHVGLAKSDELRSHMSRL